MKDVLARHGLPTAQWRVVGKNELAALDFAGQVVIKPLDSQGQKGVFLAENVGQAAGWFGDSVSFSREDKILCEKYYPSNEVTVSAWISEGACTVLTVTDRVTAINGRSIGVCRSHRYPSHYAQGHESRIVELTKSIAGAFRIINGPLYVQMLIGRDGVLVNEVACRIGGAFEDVFIPRITGFDILAATVDGALYGKTPKEVPVSEGDAAYATVLMVFCRQSRIDRLPGLDEVLAIPYMCDAGFNYGVGDVITGSEHSGSRIGYAVLVTETDEQMKDSVDEYWRIMGSDYFS
jgi:biotin carboxylase